MIQNSLNAPLSPTEFEAFRDTMVIVARRLSNEQVLELSDNLHIILRRRSVRDWNEARKDTAGFE